MKITGNIEEYDYEGTYYYDMDGNKDMIHFFIQSTNNGPYVHAGLTFLVDRKTGKLDDSRAKQKLTDSEKITENHDIIITELTKVATKYHKLMKKMLK